MKRVSPAAMPEPPNTKAPILLVIRLLLGDLDRFRIFRRSRRTEFQRVATHRSYGNAHVYLVEAAVIVGIQNAAANKLQRDHRPARGDVIAGLTRLGSTWL